MQRTLLACAALAVVAACYRIYDGLEDQWNINYALAPVGGGSCTPVISIGILELARHRTAGLRGAFAHDSVVCTTSTGSFTLPAARDTLIDGRLFDAERDSVSFTLSGTFWQWDGAQVERHVLRGTSRLVVNDTLVFTAWWQGDRL